MFFIRNIFIFIINGYKKFISPFKPRTCRFYPTCSTYSIQAYQKYGVLKGTYFTVKRIIKCHPFHSGGIDELS